MKSAYSIGEFSKKTGIPIRTLHYYEEAGAAAQPASERSSLLYAR